MKRLGASGPDFASRAYPALAAQNSYIRERRSVNGLAAVVHPWETGLDNSPAWDEPLGAVPADLSLFESYTRRDIDHARASERPTNEDYARYIRLAPAMTTTGCGVVASSSSSIRDSTPYGPGLSWRSLR